MMLRNWGGDVRGSKLNSQEGLKKGEKKEKEKKSYLWRKKNFDKKKILSKVCHVMKVWICLVLFGYYLIFLCVYSRPLAKIFKMFV